MLKKLTVHLARINVHLARINVHLARMEEPAFAALRIIAGATFSFHGIQKIFGVLTRSPPAVGSQLWVGGIIELVCGLLITVGLLTRPAAFLASGTMAVAYIQFHWKLEFADSRWLPAINKGELSLLYSFLFLWITTHGAGPVSLDHRLSRNPPQP